MALESQLVTPKYFANHGRRERILSLHLVVEQANTMPAAEGKSTLTTETYIGRCGSVQPTPPNGLHGCFDIRRQRYWRKHLLCYLDNSHLHPIAFLRVHPGV